MVYSFFLILITVFFEIFTFLVFRLLKTVIDTFRIKSKGKNSIVIPDLGRRYYRTKIGFI